MDREQRDKVITALVFTALLDSSDDDDDDAEITDEITTSAVTAILPTQK